MPEETGNAQSKKTTIKEVLSLDNHPVILSCAVMAIYIAAAFGFLKLFTATVGTLRANTIAAFAMDGLIVIVCCVILYATYGKGFLWKTGERVPTSAKTAASGTIKWCVLFAIVWFASIVLPLWVDAFQTGKWNDVFGVASGNWTMTYLLLTAVAAPISEELLFRGVVFDGLSKTWMPSVLAAVISSFLFSWFHGASVVRLASTFIIGLFLCSYYARTRCLLGCMAFHSLSNLLLIPAGGMMVPQDFVAGGGPVIVSVAAFGILCALLVFEERRREGDTTEEQKEGSPEELPSQTIEPRN